MIEIFVMDLYENINQEEYTGLFNLISEERKEKVKQYKNKIDAKRSIYAGALIRYLAFLKNLSDENIHIIYNQYGKPYFHNIPNNYFNISHSGKWVVCGWCHQEIGVDIEVIKDIDLSIAKRFFAKSEYTLFEGKTQEEQKQLFYYLWTLKESYIKYKGQGLSIPLDSFLFKLEDGRIELISEDKVKPQFYSYNIDKNHKLAVCANESNISEISYISAKTIWNRFYNL